MTLAKSLKLKNRLAGDISQLKTRLTEQNVRSKQQPFDYENQAVLAELRARIGELVKVKTAIAVANAEIYDKVFTLAELKGLVNTLKGLGTQHGLFVDGSNYGHPVEVEYVAQIRKADVDKMVGELEQTMQEIQDELDRFNHTRTVEV